MRLSAIIGLVLAVAGGLVLLDGPERDHPPARSAGASPIARAASTSRVQPIAASPFVPPDAVTACDGDGVGRAAAWAAEVRRLAEENRRLRRLLSELRRARASSTWEAFLQRPEVMALDSESRRSLQPYVRALGGRVEHHEVVPLARLASSWRRYLQDWRGRLSRAGVDPAGTSAAARRFQAEKRERWRTHEDDAVAILGASRARRALGLE